MSARKVAVVGGGLGGLTAAGELARQGVEVTLFEATAQLGGKAGFLEHAGTRLDIGPTLVAMPDTVRAAFERLGASDLLPQFREVALQCAYRFSDGARFSVSRSSEETFASARTFGASEEAGLRSFYGEASTIALAAGEPYLEAGFEGLGTFALRVARRGWKALWAGAQMGTLAGLAARHVKSPQLQQFIGRFATYAGASPYQASAAFALIPHLEQAHGIFHPVGGAGALVQAAATAVQRLGVRAVLNARAHWRREGRGWVVGPEGGGEVFDAVVVNADPLAHIGRGDEPVALSGYVALFESQVPLALPHHSVGFSADYRAEFNSLFRGQVPDDLTVYLCHPSVTDSTMSEPGKSGLYVMVNAPALAHAGASDDALPQLREGARRALKKHFPEVDRTGLRLIAERTPGDLELLGAPRGSIYGFLPHGLMGPFRRPRIRAKESNFYFAGGGTHPGGGLPMVMLSGRFAAQCALEDFARARA